MTATVLAFVPKTSGRAAGAPAPKPADVVAMPLPARPPTQEKARREPPPPCVSPLDTSRFKNEAGMPVTDLEVADWCKRVGWHVLTANQRSFIDTILVTLHERPLSDAQSDWLAGLVAKINRQVFGGAA